MCLLDSQVIVFFLEIPSNVPFWEYHRLPFHVQPAIELIKNAFLVVVLRMNFLDIETIQRKSYWPDNLTLQQNDFIFHFF